MNSTQPRMSLKDRITKTAVLAGLGFGVANALGVAPLASVIWDELVNIGSNIAGVLVTVVAVVQAAS